MRAHESFRHEALLYRTSGEFLDAVVPFISDGLALQQPVLVAVIGPRIELIRNALGAAAADVAFVDMADFGRNPARLIPGCQRFIDSYGAGTQAVRGVGESIWAGRSDIEVAECQLHEGLLNLVIPPDTPLWLMCPYDVQALDYDVADHARQSHPVIMDRGDYRGSTSYSGALYVHDLFQRSLPDAPESAEARTFCAADLGTVANLVLSASYRAGLAVAKAQILAAAIRELAVDATEAGGGSGTLRMWRTGEVMICEIKDTARTTDPIIGRVEATTRAGRKGLWMANKSSDLIQVRSDPSGTAVRVHTWL